MRRIKRLPILASPFLLLVVAAFVVYNMMDEIQTQVRVGREVERLVRRNFPTTSPINRFEFHPDGTVRIRGPGRSNVTGQLKLSSQQFVDSLQENSTIHRAYETAGTSVTSKPASERFLRKVYFTTSPGAPTTQAVYVVEYPLDFGGVWGRYHIRDTSIFHVDVEWTNRGDITFALLMLFFLGPFFAVFATWRLTRWFPANVRVISGVDAAQPQVPA